MIYSMMGARHKRTRLTSSRLRRSRLLTEVAMRKSNLDPVKSEQLQMISNQLSQADIEFFEHIFKQIDSMSAWLHNYEEWWAAASHFNAVRRQPRDHAALRAARGAEYQGASYQ